MVEGPGCKLKGEVLKKTVCGQTVKYIESSESSTSKSYEAIKTFAVKDVKTLGKELFVVFSGTDACLRVHFLMNGSIRYNESIRTKTTQTSIVTLHLSTDVISIHDSCVDIRSSVDCLARYASLYTVDICTERFDYSLAAELLSQQSGKIVCDAIMNQEVLPGVGNIIKNEGLFNSAVNPTWRVEDLSSNQVSCLLHRLRDFSAIFYKCRKEGTALSRHYKVYGKEVCLECKGRITVCKPGDLKRLTYFCPVCQGQSPKLPGSKCGSLLGFFRRIPEDSDAEMWACGSCTLLNDLTCTTCSVCFTPRAPTRDMKQRNNIVHNLENMPERTNETPAEFRQYCDSDATRKTDACNDSCDSDNFSRKRKDYHGDVTENKNKLFRQGDNTTTVLSDQLENPICNQHKLRCTKKVVTKPGPNHGRPFFTCPMPRAKQCNFFAWGDAHFPRCHHNRVTLQRSVLKQNDNNGRKFYCCPMPKNLQCNFFQWLQ